MMREYLQRKGGLENPASSVSQLDALCEGLARVSTRDELDSIGSLLADFASVQVASLSRRAVR